MIRLLYWVVTKPLRILRFYFAWGFVRRNFFIHSYGCNRLRRDDVVGIAFFKVGAVAHLFIRFG